VSSDPVGEAIRRAVDGLPADDAERIRSAMLSGLAEFDPAVVGPDDQAIEVSAALDVPPEQRPAAADRFAAERRAFTLGAEAWRLLESFESGGDVAAETGALLARIEQALDAERLDDVRRSLAEYAMECRWILAGGHGPTSVRAAKLSR
jgi:hypothetical protein